jgi:cytochrome c-type biogenesis protein CcmH/NrfG
MPDKVAWWWWLDEMLAAQRKAQIQKLLRGLAIAAAVLVVLTLVYNRFLAPSPAVQARILHEQNATQRIQDQDWAGALAEVELALAAEPADAELLALRGILQAQLGQAAEAEASFAQSEQAAGSRVEFLRLRSQRYLEMGRPEAARADAQAFLAADSQSAMGYFLLAAAQEDLGNMAEAVTAYQEASRLADEQKNSQVAVLTRIRLGYLLQRLPSVETPQP